MKKWISAAEV